MIIYSTLLNNRAVLSSLCSVEYLRRLLTRDYSIAFRVAAEIEPRPWPYEFGLDITDI